MNDTEYVGIFFDYINNSGETALPCKSIDAKAFQNGKELTVVDLQDRKQREQSSAIHQCRPEQRERLFGLSSYRTNLRYR